MKGVSHIAVSAEAKDLKKKLESVMKLIAFQIAESIPIVTILLAKKGSVDDAAAKQLTPFLVNLATDPRIHESKVKIAVFGKWYESPPDLVDAIKKVADETKDYDHSFLNLCINYDGKEELVDACRLIARKVKLEKIDPELVTSDTIKENLYLSSFLPPDLLLIYGEQKVPALLLWDIDTAACVFLGKEFSAFSDEDIPRQPEPAAEEPSSP